MRRPEANKGAVVPNGSGGGCPYCGRRPGEGWCRAVDLGFWCQAEGLKQDPTMVIHPSPSDMSLAVAHDPDVQAATADRDVAQALFDEANARWLGVLSDFAAARLEAAHSQRFSAGSFEPTGPSRRDLRRQKKLREAEREAISERDAAHAKLVEANDRHREAVFAAQLRHVESEREARR